MGCGTSSPSAVEDKPLQGVGPQDEDDARIIASRRNSGRWRSIEVDPSPASPAVAAHQQPRSHRRRSSVMPDGSTMVGLQPFKDKIDPAAAAGRAARRRNSLAIGMSTDDLCSGSASPYQSIDDSQHPFTAFLDEEEEENPSSPSGTVVFVDSDEHRCQVHNEAFPPSDSGSPHLCGPTPTTSGAEFAKDEEEEEEEEEFASPLISKTTPGYMDMSGRLDHENPLSTRRTSLSSMTDSANTSMSGMVSVGSILVSRRSSTAGGGGDGARRASLNSTASEGGLPPLPQRWSFRRQSLDIVAQHQAATAPSSRSNSIVSGMTVVASISGGDTASNCTSRRLSNSPVPTVKGCMKRFEFPAVSPRHHEQLAKRRPPPATPPAAAADTADEYLGACWI